LRGFHILNCSYWHWQKRTFPVLFPILRQSFRNRRKWLKEWTFQTFVNNWLTSSIQSFLQAVWYDFFVQWKKLYYLLFY
jgi:hypothetical protein